HRHDRSVRDRLYDRSLFRGGASVGHGRFCRHGRLLQVPAARRHRRMSLIAEIAVSLLLIIGGVFVLVGSWGLAKLPSVMTRLHGPTKATTLGVGACLIASMIYFPVFGGAYSAHELLITLFLFLT